MTKTNGIDEYIFIDNILKNGKEFEKNIIISILEKYQIDKDNIFYKKLSKDLLQIIISEYNSKIIEYKNELINRIKVLKIKLRQNNTEQLTIIDRITMYQKQLDSLTPFNEEKFIELNKLFKNSTEYIEYEKLPIRKDVLEEIDYLKTITKEENLTLDKAILNLEENEHNDLGWNIEINYEIKYNKKAIRSIDKKFIQAPPELIYLINQVTYFINKLTITYKQDFNYPIFSYNRKNIDSSLEEGIIKTYENGILSFKIDEESITEKEINEQIKYIDKLINKLLKYEITSSSKINLQKGKSSNSHNNYNWHITSKTYNKENIIKYCYKIKIITTLIKKIISSSKQNEKKAKYFKSYFNFYNRLYTKFSAIKQYTLLIQKCNDRQEELKQEEESINLEIKELENKLYNNNSSNKHNKTYKKNGI